MKLKKYDIENYLMNNSLSIYESEENNKNFYLYEKVKDNVIQDIKKIIENTNEKNILNLEGFNYHYHYLIETNLLIKKIMNKTKKLLLLEKEKEYEETIRKINLKIKRKFYNVPFELLYKKINNEEYPLYYIPYDKIEKYYLDNPS